MSFNNPKRIIALCLSFICYLSASSQVNLKVGYDLSYFRTPTLDNILNQYNTNIGIFEEEMKPIRFVSGLSLGLRYKFGTSALEVAINTGNKQKGAAGIEASGDVLRNKIFYGIRSYSIGFQTFINDFGYGMTIGRRRVDIRTDAAGDNDLRLGILESNNYASRFYLMYQLPSASKLSLTFMPFIEIPWGKTDLTPLTDNLGVNLNDTDYSESFRAIGLSLVFYNGPR